MAMLKRARLGSTLKLLEFTHVKRGLPFDGSMIDLGPPPPPPTLASICGSEPEATCATHVPIICLLFYPPKSGFVEGPFTLVYTPLCGVYNVGHTIYNTRKPTPKETSGIILPTWHVKALGHPPTWHVKALGLDGKVPGVHLSDVQQSKIHITPVLPGRVSD